MSRNEGYRNQTKEVLMLASVVSMIGQFNMENILILRKMGYEVHVACNFLKGNTCDRKQVQRYEQKLKQMQVVCHQWDCPRKVYAAGKCQKAYLQLNKLMKEHEFLWIHCHSPVGGVLARLAARKWGMRVIYTAHGFHFYKGAPFKNWLLYYPVEKLLSYCTDVLITVNREDYCLACKKMHAKKIVYIPGVGIDTQRFWKSQDTQFRIKYQIPKDALLLLSVGELSRRKNHRVVLEALAALKKYKIYYVICGQGELKTELMCLARKLLVDQRIRMIGFTEQVDEIYKNADIFVFPSCQEGMPAALMEAMSAGLPCVVSDIRGNRELIDEGQGGVRFEVDDIGGLCRALLFLADRQRREAYGAYNRKKIRKYDNCVVMPEMKKIYEEMAGFSICR